MAQPGEDRRWGGLDFGRCVLAAMRTITFGSRNGGSVVSDMGTCIESAASGWQVLSAKTASYATVGCGWHVVDVRRARLTLDWHVELLA